MRETTNIEPVIVEYGFVDNASDSLRVQKNWDIYAEAAIRGLMNYLNLPYTPPDAGKVVYIVRPGDTLFSIANRFNTTVAEIMRLNNLTSTTLSIGQQLLIPGSGLPETPPSGNITYVVKSGDTLFSIANRFNTTVDAIVRLNNLTTTALSIGQQLLIPGVSVEIPETSPIIYTVVSGDNLYSIAQRFNTTVNEIMQMNNLTSTTLTIGQRLLLPRSTEPVTEVITYTVRSGDTLFSIANRFNTTIEEIMRINNLTTTELFIGQQLLIPANGVLLTHTVVSGDTLFSLAQLFNTTVDAIMRLNNLTSTSLTIGQRILIPS